MERIVPERDDQRPLAGRPHAPDEAPGWFRSNPVVSNVRTLLVRSPMPRTVPGRAQNAGMRRSLGYSAPTTCWIVTARTI